MTTNNDEPEITEDKRDRQSVFVDLQINEDVPHGPARDEILATMLNDALFQIIDRNSVPYRVDFVPEQRDPFSDNTFPPHFRVWGHPLVMAQRPYMRGPK